MPGTRGQRQWVRWGGARGREHRAGRTSETAPGPARRKAGGRGSGEAWLGKGARRRRAWHENGGSAGRWAWLGGRGVALRLPSLRSAAGAPRAQPGRLGAFEGAAASVDPRTHAPGKDSLGTSCLRAVQPLELPTGNLPQLPLPAELCVHTAGAEGRTAPASSPSRRPRLAQAQCAQAGGGRSPSLGSAPHACAVRPRPSVGRMEPPPSAARRRGRSGRSGRRLGAGTRASRRRTSRVALPAAAPAEGGFLCPDGRAVGSRRGPGGGEVRGSRGRGWPGEHGPTVSDGRGRFGSGTRFRLLSRSNRVCAGRGVRRVPSRTDGRTGKLRHRGRV